MSLSATTTTMAQETESQPNVLTLAADGPAAVATSIEIRGSDKIGNLDRPSHPDHDWWWQRTGPLLATLLRSAGSYTED